MKSFGFWIKAVLAALMFWIFAICAPVFATEGVETADTEASATQAATITVAELHTYIVQKGDTLERLSRRFGVTLNEIVAANPVFEKRSIHRIYRGEKLMIPLYQAEVKPVIEVPQDALVIVEKGEVVNEAGVPFNVTASALEETVVNLQNTAEKKTEAIIRLFALFLICAIILGAVAILRLRKTRNEMKKLQEGADHRRECAERYRAETLECRRGNTQSPARPTGSEAHTNDVPEKVLKLLQYLTGFTLVKINQIPLTYDESGNPVFLKNIERFIASRPYLEGIPVNRWKEAMEVTRRQQMASRG